MNRLLPLILFPLVTVGLGAPSLGESTDGRLGGDPMKQERAIEPADGTVRCVVYSSDGKLIAAGGDQSVHLFNAKTGARVNRLEGHTGVINHVAFSDDDTQLASASEDKTIRIWEAKSGKLFKVLNGGADGNNHVHLNDLPVRCVAFLPDGKRLVSCGTNHYVTLWDLASGTWEVKVWTNHADKNYRDGCYHLALTRDGKQCAVAGGVCRQLFTRQVSLFEVSSGLKPVWNREHDGELAATHMAFSRDGTKLLSCGQDNSVRIWDVKTGRLSQALLGPDGHRVMQAALLTPDDSRVVAVTREGMLRLWAVGNGELLASTKASEKSVLGLALSPNGTTAATCGEDRAIQLWDLSQKTDK